MLTTSAGQVFLSYLPDALTEPILEAARAAHPTGPGDEEIARIKTEVRRQGFAVTKDAMIPGATAVAAPVFATEASLPLVVVIVLPRSHGIRRSCRRCAPNYYDDQGNLRRAWPRAVGLNPHCPPQPTFACAQ